MIDLLLFDEHGSGNGKSDYQPGKGDYYDYCDDDEKGLIFSVVHGLFLLVD
jgi:hypothetical protein